MLDFTNFTANCAGIHRRSFLRVGGLTLFGLSLPQLLAAQAAAGAARKDVNCILLWTDGGMSNIDTLDMKPDAPVEYRGEFKPISTNLPGVQVCEHLPLMAQRMDQRLPGAHDRPQRQPARRGLPLHAHRLSAGARRGRPAGRLDGLSDVRLGRRPREGLAERPAAQRPVFRGPHQVWRARVTWARPTTRCWIAGDPAAADFQHSRCVDPGKRSAWTAR